MEAPASTSAAAAAAAADRRKELLQLAKDADKTSRYGVMLTAMCNVAKMGLGFTEEEIGMLTKSFDHLIDEKSKAWEKEHRENENPIAKKDAMELLEGEVQSVSMTLVEALNGFLIPNATVPKDLLSYHHMVARYMWTTARFFDRSVETMKGVEYGTMRGMKLRLQRNKSARLAMDAQEAALTLAKANYTPTSPDFLAVALKTSSLYGKLKWDRAYEVLIDALAGAKSSYGTRSENTEKLKRMMQERIPVLLAMKLEPQGFGWLDDAADWLKCYEEAPGALVQKMENRGARKEDV